MTEAKYPQLVQTLNSFAIETIATEVLSFFTSAGAADAGEAAGTIVYAKLAKGPVLNKLGDRIGEYNPASAFATSVTFTTEVMDSAKEVGFVAMGPLGQRMADTATVLSFETNGAWALDYSTGLLVIKKASAATTQTITSYKVAAGSSSTSSGASYDTPSDSDKVTVLNPCWTYYSSLLQEDILNIPVATPAVRYVDVEGVGTVIAHFDLINAPGSGGALTYIIEASAENNGTAEASASFVNITQYGTTCLTAGAAASFTADCAHKIDCKGWKFLRFTITATGDDTGDASIYINQAY
jgi:hypothetical protein